MNMQVQPFFRYFTGLPLHPLILAGCIVAVMVACFKIPKVSEKLSWTKKTKRIVLTLVLFLIWLMGTIFFAITPN